MFAAVGASSASSAEASRSLLRELWRLAWPAALSMALVTSTFVVDRLLLAQHSAVSLASLQLSATLLWALYFISSAFSVGTIAVVGRLVGAGQRAEAARAAKRTLAFAALVGVLLALVVALGSASLLPLLFPRAEAEVLAAAGAYLQIAALGLPFGMVQAAAAAALQGAGDTRTPLKVALWATVTNGVLSGWLIFGGLGMPALGVRGAAIGTACASLLQGVLLLHALRREDGALCLRRARTRLWQQRCPVLRLSGFAYLERFVDQAGYLGFTAIMGLLGTAALSVNQAVSSIEAVCFLTAEGVGVAVGALVAQKLGAREPREAGLVIAYACAIAAGLLGVCAVVFVLVPRLLVSPFVSSESALSLGTTTLVVCAISQPLVAVATVLSHALRGAGDTRGALGVTGIGMITRLIFTYWLAVELAGGLVGAWWGATIDWAVRAALCAVLVVRHRAFRASAPASS